MWDLVLEFAAVIGWCRSTAEHLAWQSSPSFSSLRSACITSILGGGFVVTRFRLLFVCRAIFSSTHLPRASRSIACHFAADALYSLLWCLVEYIAHFTSNHNLLTVMYMRYYLPLNKSSLVFFPPQSLVDLQGPYIVQVMIKQAQHVFSYHASDNPSTPRRLLTAKKQFMTYSHSTLRSPRLLKLSKLCS